MEDFSRNVSYTVSDRIFVLDRSGAILTVNKTWCDVVANDAADIAAAAARSVIGCNYLEICDTATGASSEQAAALAQGIRAVIGGELETFTLEYPCHDLTEQRWFKARVMRLQGDGGHVMVVHEDITERHLAEAALQESEMLLRRSLMLLPEAVIISRDARISFANEAARQLFGSGEAALLGRSLPELMHFDPIERVCAQMLNLDHDDAIAPPSDMKIRRPDGSVRIVEATTATIENPDQTLILTVLHDVTELRHIKTELARAYADLQRLTAARESIQESERKRIARDLHDDLQQLLAAIKMDVVEIEQRLAVDPAGVAPMLAAIDQLATASIVSTRRIVNDLRPQVLDGLGLVPALDVLVRQFGKRTAIHSTFHAQIDRSASVAPSAEVATCLYRVAQEALNNVVKHSQASAVAIRLSARPGGPFVLRITDNGRGISAENRRKPGSFGLLGMQERVRALGGFVAISAEHGAGATVEVCVPYKFAAHDSEEPLERRRQAWDSLIAG